MAGPHAELPRGGSGPVWQIAGYQGLHVTSSVPSPTEETQVKIGIQLDKFARTTVNYERV